jgi:hypothetical protein
MRALALLLSLTLAAPVAGPALAQGGPRVMEDPSSHPEGDGMGPGRRSGMPFMPATPDEVAARCGADRLQHLVGRRWPQPLPEGARPVRIYAQGDPVTMDMSPERLNVELDAQRRRILAIRCG